MKSEKELKKWLETLLNHYYGKIGEEQLRLEVQIETLQSVLDIDQGTFEGTKQNFTPKTYYHN